MTGLGPTEGIVIGGLLESATRLATLVLSNNRIGDEGAKALGASLTAVGASLATLHLEMCGVGAAGAAMLAAGLATSTSLRTLSLSENTIGDAGATAIGESLTRADALETLMLSQCGIGAEAR